MADSRMQLWDRRLQWSCLENKAEIIFNDAITQSKESRFWENLYVDKSPRDFDLVWDGNKYKHFSMISLCMGNHPTDISYEEFSEGKKRKRGIITEKGGALLIYQLPSGGVTFSLYPSKSDMHNFDSKPKLIKVFDQPFDVTEDYIKKAIKHMLIYSQDTSYMGFYPYWKYIFESIKKHRKEILFLVIGATISLGFAIFYEIFTKTE